MSPTIATGTARLIAIDWGTTNLRASLLGAGGVVLDTRAQPGGIMQVPGGAFEDALIACCGDWITQQRVPLIASGMIGSRQGWREAAYLDCPAGPALAAARLTRVALAGDATLHIVPGLTVQGSDGEADVMRGEETQIWGADLPDGSLVILPGTHAKWAWLGTDNSVRDFRTFMTGELFGLLTKHGILGRLMEFGQDDVQAFTRGVRLGLAEHANATHVIFAARTAGLTGKVAPAALPDFLSGILIGIEIGSARAGRRETATHAVLLGDDGLCARYAMALDCAGITHQRAPAEATTRGQWRIAERAGLMSAAKGDAA